MSSKVTFTFDNNPLGVYYSGQVISGTAQLITDRPKTIRSIFITVNGFGETRWQENVERTGSDGKPTKVTETHTSTQIYYSTDKYVYGQSGGSQLELPKGKYLFPFEATIPPNAPTSFNGAHGQINHEVILTIDRAVRYNNTFKQCFSVILPNDLNQKREHQQPLKRIEEKTFWWGSIFGSKPMIMDVSTSYSAYVPGQKLNFKVVLDNQSEVQCQDVKVRLFKNVTYRANSGMEHFKTTEERIADKHCGEVLKHNKAEFNEFFLVPPTTPTTLAERDPIKVSYTLRFIAKTFRLHGGGDLIVDFPLAIGTVPLYGSENDKGPSTPSQGQPSASNTYHLPPPNFQEDVSKENFESNKYKPRYAVYLPNAQPQNGNGIAKNTQSLYPNVADSPKSPVQFTPNPVPAAVSPPGRNASPYPIQANATSPKSPPYPINSPPTVAAATTAKPTVGTKGDNFEVLGFSIPPDYQPTPSAPVAAAGKTPGTFGWK